MTCYSWNVQSVSPFVRAANEHRHSCNGRYAIGSNPSWSPDGSRIAFESRRAECYAIYVMNPDGSELKALTDGTTDDWNTDG